MWNFATDSHGKDKANAGYPLKGASGDWRKSRTLRRTVNVPKNNNDTVIASRGDGWSDLNRNVNTMTKNSLRSPWKDEEDRQDDRNLYDIDCKPSNVDQTICVNDTNAHSTVLYVDNDSKRNTADPKLVEKDNSFSTAYPQQSNQSVDRKWREQKYHWSGTFNDRVKKYSSLGCNANEYRKTFHSASEIISIDRKYITERNYNYNLNREKTPSKRRSFYYNKFSLEDESSEGNENANVSRKNWKSPCKRQDNYQLNKEENVTNETAIGLDDDWRRSTIDEQCSPKSSARLKNSCDNSTLCTTVIEKPRCSIGIHFTLKICTFMLSFLKTIIFFAFVPSLYIIFFLYVEGKQN